MLSESTPSSGRLPLLAGYEILARIGEGGNGEVYRARLLDLDKVVAVKVLRPSRESTNPVALPLEPGLLISLRHPHIVAILDSVQIGSTLCLILEHVAGGSLRPRLHPGSAWPVPQALSVIQAIASALTFIHGRGLLHLDLKPENVLCDFASNTYKVTDFGLSLHQADVRSISELTAAQGSIDYCAPEQRFGLRVDVRTDLFALATITYELLTGRLPGRVYYPATRRNPRLPPAVDAVLRAGLARDPGERQSSIADFQQDLSHALASLAPVQEC